MKLSVLCSDSIIVTFKGEELATGTYISIKDGTYYIISDCTNYICIIGIYSIVSFGKFLIDSSYEDIELPDIVPTSSAIGKTSFSELEVNAHSKHRTSRQFGTSTEEVAHASRNVMNLLPFSTPEGVGAALFQYCLDCRNAIT